MAWPRFGCVPTTCATEEIWYCALTGPYLLEQKMKRRPFWIRVLFVTLLTILGVWYVGSTWLRRYPGELLSHSTLLLQSEMYTKHGMLVVIGPTSEHELLCDYMKGYADDDFFLIDTQTGQQTFLNALSMARKKNLSTPVSLSPDGRWLYCSATNSENHCSYHYLFEVNGKRTYSLATPERGDSQFVWTVDSQACIGLDKQNRCLLTWSLASPQHLTKLSKNYVSGDALGCSVTQELLITTRNWLDVTPGASVPIVALPVVEGRPIRPIGKIVPRTDGFVREVKVSPHGRRLAWLVLYTVSLPKPAWLRSIFRRFGQQDRDYIALWTSRLDGSDAHEIGHVLEDSDTEPRKLIGAWGWAYEGKSLWYEYGDHFWKVDVD